MSVEEKLLDSTIKVNYITLAGGTACQIGNRRFRLPMIPHSEHTFRPKRGLSRTVEPVNSIRQRAQGKYYGKEISFK